MIHLILMLQQLSKAQKCGSEMQEGINPEIGLKNIPMSNLPCKFGTHSEVVPSENHSKNLKSFPLCMRAHDNIIHIIF